MAPPRGALLPVIICCISLIGTGDAVAFEQVIRIRESQLAAFINEAMPGFNAIRLQDQAAELEEFSHQDQYTTFFGSRSKFGETDDPRVPQQVQSQAFQIQQKTKAGIGLSGGILIERQKLAGEPFLPFPFANQRLYLPVLMAGIEVDLWKNFLGRFDRMQQQYLQAKASQTQMKSKLDRKSLHITLRSLFWRLASQNRRIELYRQLVQSAEKAYQDARARLRDHVADQGMVAKMSANLSAAQAQYQAASIQKHLLEKELKTLIPSFQGRELEIVAAYQNIRHAVKLSVNCAETVGKLRSIPFDHTDFDELIRLLQEALQHESRLIQNYDRADLKLTATAQSFGMDEDFTEAQKQSASFEKNAYEVLLSVDIPLGKQLSHSKQRRLELAERKTRLDQSQLEAQFKATHDGLTQVIQHLSQAVELFHRSIGQLESAFANAGTKFRQGRIAVHEYLADQNALLETQLQVLTIEERIILETLNYFRVFNSSPCEFNRI